MWLTVFALAAILALCLTGIAVLVEEPEKLGLSNSKNVVR